MTSSAETTVLAGKRRILTVAAGLLSAALTADCSNKANLPQQFPPFSPGTNAESLLSSPTGEANAEAELASRLMVGRGVEKDTVAGASIWESLAQSGNARAQFLIGEYYFSGTGVERKPDVAISWLQKAADQNYSSAQAELAFCYVSGTGVARDYKRAFELAKAAADRDNVEGIDILGQIYANGWGINQDAHAALQWFTKAANKKFSPAMLHLGASYRDGTGVPTDKVIAAAWFDLALENAYSRVDQQAAVKNRDDLALVLLPEDLALAHQLAASWKPGKDLAVERATTSQVAAATQTPDQMPNGSKDTAVAATSPIAGFTTPAADLPYTTKSMTYDVDVAADGSRTTTVHYQFAAKNESAAKDIGQIPLPFISSLQTVNVLEAYTLKPQGQKIPVDPSAIYTQLIPGTPNVPMFDDQRQKVVVFPTIEPGDQTVVTARYTSKPTIPGYFSYSNYMDLTLPYDDIRITITAPKSMPLVTETHGMKFERHEIGDKISYEWRAANLAPLRESNIALHPLDRWPRFFASNFGSYDQLAKAYAALAEPKTAVTPKIQKLADEITSGITDRKKIAETIYNWVSRHIRYVGVEIGIGSVVPHEADAILASGYGDCKDHTVLFAALLKAKGIASEIVLINFGESYTLPSAPTLGTLNHAITWLPEFNLYADTTAGTAPFGTLPFGEYGKPVVHVASKQVIRRTPDLANGAATITLKTSGRLDSEGHIVGDSESVSSGPFGVALRGEAAAIQAMGLEQAASLQLRSRGYEGTGKFAFDSPFELAPTYRITGHFETGPRADIVRGNSFYLPLGLALGPVPGELLAGSLAFRDFRGDEPTPCYSGREEEELSLELPTGKHLRELPKGTEIRNEFLDYKSKWSLTGNTVTVQREFSVTVDQAVCIGQVRTAVAKALNDIRKDYNAAIALIDN